ncbi:E3 ubiquitin-protein ligase BIG BROTHER-like isoform X2 [Mangifera indica]|uniref:E3 ubiquitin-protein ligase BIG BROTHER-like isoform X2 n=1 Tax=Mangifera indica TaxID=29780 RepID=UPI001CF9F519|nr:E3 ubiquitin-protein ligase BIG BROTHER-like isoform X2 [Mangifera indica]
MSWNPHVEVQYRNTSYPYNSAGSFIEYFEGLTYEHVNFIFDGTSHVQESVYPLMDTSLYKFGLSESESTSYYNYGHPCEVNYHDPCSDDHRRPSENTVNNEQNAAVNTLRERNRDTTTRESVECPWRHHNTHDYQLVWQDSIDPDNMTYEELLELGETVGSQNRGLSQDLIALLPISEYKCGLFSWKKSRNERWSINEVTCASLYHASMRTMLLVGPGG